MDINVIRVVSSAVKTVDPNT